MKGGMADNAIPKEAEAEILVREADREEVISWLDAEASKIRESLQNADSGFVLEKLFHNGIVVAMSKDVEGLVETSLNLGVLSVQEEKMRLQYAVRSSIDQDKGELCRHMLEIAERMGASASVRNEYPGWAYRKDSPLREKMVRVYEEMYGKKPVLEAIHAGLECGILAGKIKDLDCVSIGPDLENVHTAQESMSVDSVERVWNYLLDVLTMKDAD